MTATYNADNTITEQPRISPPRIWLEPGIMNPTYREEEDEYNTHLAIQRTLVCSPECCGLWADGQKLEEGKDYEVKSACLRKFDDDCVINHPCDRCELLVFPLPVKSEAPFIWTDELVKDYAEQYRFSSSRISIEQFKYSLTKR